MTNHPFTAIARPARLSAGLLLLAALWSAIARANDSPASARVDLQRGWKIQSSCVVNAPGDKISAPGFSTEGWLAASVPGTVLGAQVEAGNFREPFFGMNLRRIPGTDYPIGKIYGNLPMTEGSPYRCAWWYRIEFPRTSPGRTTWLHLNGVNYRANLWLNGKLVVGQDEVAGAFRAYEFDIEKYLVPERNVLAAEVFAQGENDLGISFIDWNPAPADKSLGLWRDVYLRQSGPVVVRNPAVKTRFSDDQLSAADLTVIADVQNHTAAAVSATVIAEIGKIRVAQVVQLQANERKVVRFTAGRFAELHLRSPQVWWPYQYGVPHLETLRIRASVKGVESDRQQVKFGIREAQAALNDQGYEQFRINRRNILIKGGGWAPDMFYREPAERLRRELEYVRDLGLNTIRLEGKLGSDVMFDLADEMGILIMAGWACCDHWEHWEKWSDRDHEIANAALYSQISRLRSHPSLLVWLNGSDGPPPARVESDYIAVLKERDWPNPYLSSAAARETPVTGPSGVKMSGPYDYVPPEYWSLDHDRFGGAWGFNTETSPGPAVPTADIIRRTLPPASWWPQDEQWNFHAALGKFAQYDIFNRAMSASYGEPKDLEDYTRKAQLMTYDGERAMFEAYGANKYASTGVIQWMLNNAWPSFHWHLYDYYLAQGGGYFGAKKANEPLHVQYRYDGRAVLVVNSTLTAHTELRVQARLMDAQGRPLFGEQAAVSVAADGVARAFSLPEQQQLTFLELTLAEKSGRQISRNFYWLPARLAQLDWAKGDYFHTPGNPYADMRALGEMPKAAVTASARLDRTAGRVLVTLANRGGQLAFFVRARAVKPGSDEQIVPVFWDDNYISLPPGETQSLVLTFPAGALPPAEIRIDGWNVDEQILRPR